MTPDRPATLGEALLLLQSDLPTVAKRQTAKMESSKGSYSYKYAGLQAVTAAILPRLNRLGLVFVARPAMVEGRFVLCCELIHAATGERLAAEYPITAAPNAPAQAIGSAISYGRRYCLTAMTAVVAEDDDQERPARGRGRATEDEPPRAMSQPQQRKLMALLKQAGHVERDQRLAYCSAATGRELASSSELTFREAGQLIEGLEAALAETHDEGAPA